MKHSKDITQQPETVENPNIFDIESVTIDHPKTTTKLSKPLKRPKIITENSKHKIKDYRETNK